MEIKTEYQIVLEKLFQKRPKMNEGPSDDVHIFLKKLKSPQLSFPTIHVAGTNGKGQVSVKIAKALEIGGYRVGLFISPHLFTFEERIRINGEKISQEQVIAYEKHLVLLAEKLHLTLHFFEFVTCMAFSYFKEQNVDIAIIEAGLGGKWDTTNVVEPLVSVIPSISLDHVDHLGKDIKKIAEHKAGIIKPYVPVVIGPNANYPEIFDRAKKVCAPVYVVEERFPFYDLENQAIAKKTLNLLTNFFPLASSVIEEGLGANLPCRFERKGNVIFDVAHNPDSFERLMQALNHFYPEKSFRFVVGMNIDKDIERSLSKIHHKTSHIHFVQAKHPLSASLETLKTIWQSISTHPYSLEPSIQEGMRNAKAVCEEGDILVVCGSFYIMADACNYA